ncbi:hypothetical protein QTP81_01665 [Alteromonas sp. ASW11-36]|uniref:PEP-CTERM sorting domain-containing protein n=1 Tax=Alteromonas arenosi TaxID=3055817 RepID=A0ABT7ST23_9ALTE|nr:hypothetical protein [Alteromonas sp. ASW11-36]MDM7859311.1 hypothetical protein [Alteromonas sp. ASW11-36]
MKLSTIKFLQGLMLVASLSVSGLANAIIIYTDASSFQNDNVVTFVSTPSSGGNGSVAGSLTFTSGPSASVFFGNFTNLLQNELALSGVENFNVDIAGGAYAFGFDVTDPRSSSLPNGCNVSSCVDSVFSFSIFSGNALVGSFSFNPLFSDSVLTFVGVYSNTLFDRVEIRETAGTNDNEYFGNFQLSTVRQSVSEPGMLVFFSLSALALLNLRRKIKAFS